MNNPVYRRVYRIIKQIPKGCVATYGQIARLAGIGGQPRRVGYALSVLPENVTVPWHRVVNAKGGISPRTQMGFAQLQRVLLEKEGIAFDRDAKISLARFQWIDNK